MTTARTQDSHAHEPAEGQTPQPKSKRLLIRRIFKYFGLAVLVLLVMAALIFQAPWKVVTLLLVILAACTILPKPARKWFWLSVAAILIALGIWVFLPEDDEGWRPYTFDDELAALEAKYAVPDSENAAVVYDEVFKDMDGDANEPGFFLRSSPSSKDEPWLSKDHPETAEWLKGHQNTIEKLLQAAKKDKCRFPIVADQRSFARYMERSPKMRCCAYLLVCAANNDLAEGRVDQGIEKNLAILQMAKHVCQQPMIIDMLSGIAVEELSTAQFNRFAVTGNATQERLNIIEQALAGIKHDWCCDLPRFLECEKLMVKNTFCSLAYQVNPQGKVRLSRDPYAGMREEWQEELKAGEIQDPEELAAFQRMLHPTYWQRKLAKAGVILAYLGMPSTPKKVSENVDAGFQRLYAMAEPDFDWAKSPNEFRINPMKIKFNWIYVTRTIADMMAGLSEESCYRIHDLYLRSIAEQRGTRIIIALRRYKNKTGHWPENLEEVESFAPAEIFVDPINRGSFVYKLAEENFTLYSKGKNNIDEGGEYETEWDADYADYKVKEDDLLIWPPLY